MNVLILTRTIFKILNTFLYSILYCYSDRLKINFFKSYFSGSLTIDDGILEIKDGLRNKKNLLISIKNGHLIIGEKVFFNNNVSINCHLNISIGDNCLFGENITIYDHNHNFNNLKVLIRYQGFNSESVKIGNNVWIGSNVIILPGSCIGDNAVVAAGSIVNCNIPTNSVFVQKRSKTIKELC